MLHPIEEKAKPLRENIEAPSDHHSEQQVSDHEDDSEEMDMAEKPVTGNSSKHLNFAEVGELGETSEATPSVARSRANTIPDNTVEGPPVQKPGNSSLIKVDSGPTIQFNENYSMAGEYAKKMEMAGRQGSKNLANIVSKQLAFAKKGTVDYDDLSAR